MVSLLPATATVIGIVVLTQMPTPLEAAGVAWSSAASRCTGIKSAVRSPQSAVRDPLRCGHAVDRGVRGDWVYGTACG